MNEVETIKENLQYRMRGLELGCEDKQRIEKCMEEEDFATALLILKRNRCEVLAKLHASQEALDNLDFCVFEIKQLKK